MAKGNIRLFLWETKTTWKWRATTAAGKPLGESTGRLKSRAEAIISFLAIKERQYEIMPEPPRNAGNIGEEWEQGKKPRKAKTK